MEAIFALPHTVTPEGGPQVQTVQVFKLQKTNGEMPPGCTSTRVQVSNVKHENVRVTLTL